MDQSTLLRFTHVMYMEESLPHESEIDSHVKVPHMTYSVIKGKKRQNFSAGILEEFVDATS